MGSTDYISWLGREASQAELLRRIAELYRELHRAEYQLEYERDMWRKERQLKQEGDRR